MPASSAANIETLVIAHAMHRGRWRLQGILRLSSGAGRGYDVPMRNLITDVPGLKVGHGTDARRGSGSSVVVFDEPAVASIDVRGGGPGTRETALFDPALTVQGIDAITLS